MLPTARPFSQTLTRSSFRVSRLSQLHNTRALHQSHVLREEATHQHQRSDPRAHANFWKSHGRAIAKALTLAFLSYQVFYWAWITLETEQLKDAKGHEIKSLEGEVRLLEEGRKSHRPTEQVQDVVEGEGKRVLEETARKS